MYSNFATLIFSIVQNFYKVLPKEIKTKSAADIWKYGPIWRQIYSDGNAQNYLIARVLCKVRNL